MNPHDFQRAGLAYSATDAWLLAGRPGTEGAALAHWLQISGRHWYKPLAMRGYAAPWFFLHDAGLLIISGQAAIRPHASALSWNPAQQTAYDDYATYLGRLARVPLIDSVRRWLRDLGQELSQRGLSEEARAQAELQVILAALEWLLDTIEPIIGWRRLATDLRWQSSADADAVLMNPIGNEPEIAVQHLRNGLTPDGETPPERPFLNFLRQLIGTGELLWKPAARADVTRRWFNEIAIRAASDFHGTVQTTPQRSGSGIPITSLAHVVPDAPMRTRALRPLDTALIERYLNRHVPIADEQIQMELDYSRQEQVVDIENPMRTFIEGLSGIARRGPMSAMLRRELADDDLFYAKFADNSLLYFSRPELLSVPYSLFMGILADNSLNAALPDGTSARSVAKELALYLLDTARLIPSVTPGLPVDGYLFQFGEQGAEYQTAETQDTALAQLGLNLSLTPETLPGEFWLDLNEPPGDLRDPWLLRSEVLAASYFNLSTMPGHWHPPVSTWDASGVVYPVQPPHTWDASMPTREGSHLTGKLAVLSGNSVTLTVRALSGALTSPPTPLRKQRGEPRPNAVPSGSPSLNSERGLGGEVNEYVATRAQPVVLDCAFPAGSTYRLSVEATGYAPVGYRLNLRLSPGARSLHIGPRIWPAVSRLAFVARQRLAQRESDADQSSAYSLAHLIVITADDFTGEMADQIQRYVRNEFEAIARQVTIHVFRLSPSKGTVSWQLDRGDYRRIKPPQPEPLDILRKQSRIRIQFWRELRRDLEALGD